MELNTQSRFNILPMDIQNKIYKVIFNDVISEMDDFFKYKNESNFLEILADEYDEFLNDQETAMEEFQTENITTYYVFRKFADKIAKILNIVINKDDMGFHKKLMTLHLKILNDHEMEMEMIGLNPRNLTDEFI